MSTSLWLVWRLSAALRGPSVKRRQPLPPAAFGFAAVGPSSRLSKKKRCRRLLRRGSGPIRQHSQQRNNQHERVLGPEGQELLKCSEKHCGLVSQKDYETALELDAETEITP